MKRRDEMLLLYICDLPFQLGQIISPHVKLMSAPVWGGRKGGGGALGLDWVGLAWFTVRCGMDYST